jgi:diacylglycerol O-acyltransferase
MHHAAGDGMAGVATLGTLLDATRDKVAEPGPPWTPAPLPTTRDLFADNLRRHVDNVRGALSMLAQPLTTLQRLRPAFSAMRELAKARAPRTSLDRVVATDRNLALIRGGLDEVKEVAHRYDAKINDVLLAVIAGGLRGLFRSRGEPVENLMLPVYVPIALRHGQRGQLGGNLIGRMVVPLPLGVSDPGQRLRQIAVETAKRKAKNHPQFGTVFRSRIARWARLKVLDRQPVSVTTADLPGPQVPLSLAGARVLKVFPVRPLLAKVSLGVGALSSAGQFNIMAVADRAACPDLDVFAGSARAELRALRATSVPT